MMNQTQKATPKSCDSGKSAQYRIVSPLENSDMECRVGSPDVIEPKS